MTEAVIRQAGKKNPHQARKTVGNKKAAPTMRKRLNLDVKDPGM